MSNIVTNRPLREVKNIRGYDQSRASTLLQWYEGLLADGMSIWPNTGRYTLSASPGPHVRLSGMITIKVGNDTIRSSEKAIFPHERCKNVVDMRRGSDVLTSKVAELRQAIECNKARVAFNEGEISYEAYSSHLRLFKFKWKYNPIWFTSAEKVTGRA